MSRCGHFYESPPGASRGELDRLVEKAIRDGRPMTDDQMVHLRARVWYKWLEERRLTSHLRGQEGAFNSALFNQWWVLERLLPFEETLAIQVEINMERTREVS